MEEIEVDGSGVRILVVGVVGGVTGVTVVSCGGRACDRDDGPGRGIPSNSSFLTTLELIHLVRGSPTFIFLLLILTGLPSSLDD